MGNMEDNAKLPYGVLNADCLEAMKKFPDNFIDAVVTDPPYGLSFMGKDWDHGVPGVAFWKEALRITKPGGHIVAFGGSRTYHRLTCAIEDAGWEIRDCLGWLYSSGFPKSMDISKAIDKKLGAKRAERGGVGDHEGTVDFGMKNRCPKCGKPYFSANPCTCPRDDLVPITDEAKKWSGWGTCLKPAFEPIVLARKPLEGTVVENVMKHGVGGLNIDDCRVPYEEGGTAATNPLIRELRGCKNNHGADTGSSWRITGEEGKVGHANLKGRFPANIMHDGSDEVIDAFDNKLTPDFTPIVLARKPIEGTVADNVMKYGVGGLNIDECRVPSDEPVVVHSPGKETLYDSGHGDMGTWVDNRGRFPANIIHDGSEGVLEVFPDNVKGGTWNRTKGARPFNNNGKDTEYTSGGSDKSVGSAARFFYCPKASKKEKGKDNPHPTVKPIALMEYLVKLVSPEGSKVLDPFMGSGTTGVAAINLGRKFIGIEKEPEYFEVAKKRVEEAFQKTQKVV